jgi:diguanylate cyclase (GGDEF)-like protein
MSINPTLPAERKATLSIEQEELRGIAHTVAEIHWLLLIQVLLFVIFGALDPEASAASIMALCFYAALVMAFRYAIFYRSESRWKVTIEAAAMIAFVTWVLWFTGGLSSALLGAYMLPVITSALVLGRATTLAAVVVIAVCQAFLGAKQLPSLAFLGNFVAQMTPLVLVAYIVTLFSADIRYGLSHRKLRSEIDGLTGLLNMHGFSIAGARLFGQAQRYNRAATVLIVALDNLDAANLLLPQVTRLTQAELRDGDLLARYGSGEFILLLPDTPPKGALVLAERIRNSVARAPLPAGGAQIACTVSIGVAGHPADGNTMDAVLARADQAMQQAKKQGGNRAARFAWLSAGASS